MFDEEWLEEIHVNEWAVVNRAREYEENPFDAWKTLESLLLLKAISLLDVSTLFGDDTFTNVTALVNKVGTKIVQLSPNGSVINFFVCVGCGTVTRGVCASSHL